MAFFFFFNNKNKNTGKPNVMTNNAKIENDLQTGKHIASIKDTIQKNDRLGKEMRLELEKISEDSSRTIIREVN